MEQDTNNGSDNESNISVYNKEISIDDIIEISSNEEEENELLNKSLDFKQSVSINLNLSIENEKNQSEIEEKKELNNNNIKYNPPKISKLKPKKTNDQISPMKLNLKLFGNNISENKRINDVVYNYSLDQSDAKSCPDEDENDFDDINSNDKIFKKTMKKLNLIELRKQMKNIKLEFEDNDNKLKEYENILNSDNIFNKNKKRRKSIFKKYIQQQEEINWLFSSNGPMASLNNINQRSISNTLYRSNTSFANNRFRLRNSNISILGILESVVNMKKERNTVTVI